MNYDGAAADLLKALRAGYENSQLVRARFFDGAQAAGVAICDYGIAYGLMGPATTEEMTPSEVKW